MVLPLAGWKQPIAAICCDSTAKQLIFRTDYIENKPFSYVSIGLLEISIFYELHRYDYKLSIANLLKPIANAAALHRLAAQIFFKTE